MQTRQWPVVAVLGTAQSLSWASTYYLPAVLGHDIAQDLGLSPTVFYGVVSAALVISALMGPFVGSTIDRLGGRWLLAASTIPCSTGLILLALADDGFDLALAWLFIAVGMGLGLYEAVTATLTSLFGAEARRAIATFTMAAGFSSTIGWLATTWSVKQFGWRLTCLHWATVQYVVITPLYLLLPSAAPRADSQRIQEASHNTRLTWIMGASFAASALVISGLAAHLPQMLVLSGADKDASVALASLVGPAQVLVRITEVVALSGVKPVVLAAGAAMLHPIGGALILLGLPLGTAVFPVLHGGASAILTTARATVPLALFGPHAFGQRFGRLSMGIRLVSACGPLAFAKLIETCGSLTFIFSGGLSLAAVTMLVVVHRIVQRRADGPVP